MHAGRGQARPGVNGHDGSARRRDGVGELIGKCSDAGARVSHVITCGSRVVCALEGCTPRCEHTTSQVVREAERARSEGSPERSEGSAFDATMSSHDYRTATPPAA